MVCKTIALIRFFNFISKNTFLSKIFLIYFQKKFRKQCKTVVKSHNKQVVNGLMTRHAGVLGLCSFINASPYDVPDTVPQIFLELGQHLTDPQPIPVSSLYCRVASNL